MATHQEVERGDNNVLEPFIGPNNGVKQNYGSNNGALGMVIFSTAIAVCGSFEYGICLGYSAPTQFSIMDELNLSYSEYAVVGSILNIGAMVGAITSGRITDSFGRKGAMRMSSIICIAGWLAICAALGPLLLDFGRLLTGYGIGILSYVVPVFIAEVTPNELRGALATANQLLIVTGLAVAYIIGAFVRWRIFALTGTIPCLLMLIGLCFIPESPRWLAMVDRQNEFEASLHKLRGANADISQEKADIQDSLALQQQLPKATILDLLQGRNIRLVIVGVGLMVFQQFSGVNGIIFYADSVFVSAGVPPTVGSIVYSSLQIFVTAIGAMLIDRAGRRPLLMVSASGLLLGDLLIGTSFFLKAHEMAHQLVPTLALSGVMVFIGFFSVGMGAIPWVLMSELFPLNIKGIAGSMVTLVNWLGSWLISYTFHFLIRWSSYGTFFMYAFVCCLAIVFIIKLVPETKGRTLEEIHAA